MKRSRRRKFFPGETFFLSPQIRICAMMFLAFVLFSVLGIQLWRIQVFHRRDYEEKALRQSVRKIRIPPMRGKILASDGSPLAVNRLSCDARLHLSEMRRARTDATIKHVLAEAERAAQCTGRKNPLTKERVLRHLNTRPGVPMELFQDLSEIEQARLWELSPRIEGLEISAQPLRFYPGGTLAAHLIGYVQEADSGRASDREEFFYYYPDLKGKTGIEKVCDDTLNGAPGRELVLVNSKGFVIEHLEKPLEAKNGGDVVLTIDIRAQRIAENLMAGKTGALVVLNARTGAVIAMVSAPSFRPGDFVPGISAEKYRALTSDPGKLFLNRATMGAYMPGSVIKPLCAIACLESGISADETVVCRGRTPLGYGGIACSNRYGHGEMDLYNAIKKSCNVYFVENAVKIGIDLLSAAYASAGIGRKTGIEIPERTGFLPVNGPRWNEKETAYVGFGQGKILVTPLQVANYIAAIANGGTLWTPYLIESIRSPEGARTPDPFRSGQRKRGTLAASPETLEIVREGMRRVVNERGGSGVRARISKSVLYGKTGTADVGKDSAHTKDVWFGGFAANPVSGELYSIAVLVEHGESGGRTAAPIAGKFFDQFFPDKPAPASAGAGAGAGAKERAFSAGSSGTSTFSQEPI